MLFLVGSIIFLCILSLVIDAYLHRKKASKAGGRVGSIWYHMQESKRQHKEQAARKTTEKKNAELLKKIEAHSAKVMDTISMSAPSSGWQKNIEKRSSQGAIKKETEKTVLDEVQFIYRDNSGKKTTRRVSVHAVDEKYFEGHCHARRQTRTFITRNIIGDITSLDTGEIHKASKWARAMRRLPNNAIVHSGSNYRLLKKPPKGNYRNTSAYFVGFREKRRRELEGIADGRGWRIRSTFSSSLDILVAGSLAGEMQLSKAESMGIEIISEEEFHQRF